MMKKILLICFMLPLLLQGQSPYKVNLKYDIPITAVGLGLTAYGFHRINNREHTDTSVILALDKNDLWKINQSGVEQYDENAGPLSEFFFYGGFAYPFILLFDKDIRRDAPTIGMLYLEAFALTGTNYAFTASLVDKFRPYAYNPDVPLEKRANRGSINSFPGGHPSVTATGTFMTAKIYSDYHPGSAFSYVLYGIAAVTTLSNAYLRYKGGYHFPTDLAVGVTAGTLTGILVPHLHKKRNGKATGLKLTPYTNDLSSGLSLRFVMD